jgi:glutaredoxin
LTAAAALTATPAWALYKVVGPDGKVTYTDRPPSDRPAAQLKTNGATASTEGLPYELKQVVSRYPVTLYTGKDCPPCDGARQMLKGRGVPFTEKTVTASEDLQALRQREGTEQLPVVRIGQKQLIGFSQQDWSAYLDAAGYPAKSALPLNYAWPAASPLAVQLNKKDDASASGQGGGADKASAPVADPSPSVAPPSDGSRAAPPGFKF